MTVERLQILRCSKESAQPSTETDESLTLTFLLAKGTPNCDDVGANTRPSGNSKSQATAYRFEISDLGCNIAIYANINIIYPNKTYQKSCG